MPVSCSECCAFQNEYFNGNGCIRSRTNGWPGVRQWNQDPSLFKVIPLRERMFLRLNADFFKVFNHPGNPNTIGGDRCLITRASCSSPRTLQLSYGSRSDGLLGISFR